MFLREPTLSLPRTPSTSQSSCARSGSCALRSGQAAPAPHRAASLTTVVSHTQAKSCAYTLASSCIGKFVHVLGGEVGQDHSPVAWVAACAWAWIDATLGVIADNHRKRKK